MKRTKKTEVPDYGIKIEDEVSDYGLENLFDEGVQPESQKQIVPKFPSYEESLKDLFEGKIQMYVDPQYLPPDMPPEYYGEGIDYAFNEEDRKF